MSTTANQDPQQDQHPTVGIDQLLALRKVMPLDSEFWSEEATQFLPKPFQCVRNFTLHKVDCLPTGGTAQVDWGQLVTIKYGQEGYPNLLGAELYFKLPKLVTTSHSSAHPLDAGYGGGANDYIEWLPYIAERLFCGADLNTGVRHMFSTETLRQYNADMLHIKRALHMDTEGTQKRAAYNNSVGAIADAANAVGYYRLQVWLPHGTDDVNKNQILPVQAFSQEFSMTFRMPTLAQAIRTNLTLSSIVSSPLNTKPEVFLRCTYVVTEKAERGTFANQVMSASGLTYMTMHIARELRVETTGLAAVTVTVPIKNFTLPSAAVHAIIRIRDDLRAKGDTADFTDTRVAPYTRSPGGVVARPDPVAFLPWDSYCFYDGGNRITSKRGQDDWQNSTVDGATNYYPGDFSTNILSHPFTMHPTVENHGLGHFEFMACVNPLLKIDLPALGTYDSNASAVRVIDTFSCERNKFFASNGVPTRVFNVLA